MEKIKQAISKAKTQRDAPTPDLPVVNAMPAPADTEESDLASLCYIQTQSVTLSPKILENNRIVSKERMLEVYFNIIEWGPNVYGIGEASRFYFQKSPSELNLNECLYLARIIPSPKKFMYQFNDQGMLKDFAIKQESFLTNIMFRRGLLSPDDTIYQSQRIIISGSARSFLRIKTQDTTQVKIDSLSVDEEFDL